MGSVGTGDCTADTCPVQNGFFWVAPSLAGSVVMMAAFGVLVPINFFLGVRYKTPWYSATVIAGLAFEIMGYVGRLLQRNNLADRTPFVLFLLGTVMAPTFISAAIYAVLPHIMLIYGRNISVRLRPAFIGSVFIAFDIFTLAFQGAGSAFAAGGPNKGEISQGLNLLVGGLAIQAASLVLFFVILYWFFRKITVNQEQLLDHTYSHIFLTSRFKIFLMSTQFATFFLLIRTIFRLVQLANGLDSVLAQSQILTLVLDGVLVLVAALMLTILPPGVAFGPVWADTSPYASSHPRFFGSSSDGRGPYGFRPAVADDVFSYETPVYEAKKDRLRQRESVPTHWQHPGYKQPKVAMPAPVRVPGHARGPSYEAQRNGVGGGMGTVAYEYEYKYDGSKQAHSPSAGGSGDGGGDGGGGGSANVTPTTAAPPSGGTSPHRSLAAKRMSERRDVVDPDALW